MTQEELGFYNKQDKEELVIMCIARDNKIEHLRKEIDGLVTVIDLVREYINKYLEDHIIEDQPDEQSIFYDEKGYYIPNAKEQLLEILERVNEE